MYRKRWIWVLLALVVVGVAITMFVSSLPRLLETKLRTELAQYGVAEFTLGEPYWGFSGAGTSDLGFSGSYEQWQYRVNLEKLHANYTLSALLDGEIDSLAAGTISVTVVGGPSRPADDDAILLEQIIADLSALSLPAETIVLNDLRLHFEMPETTADIYSEKLAFANAAGAISGEIIASIHSAKLGALPVVSGIVGEGELRWIPDLQLLISSSDTELAKLKMRIHKAARSDDDADRLLAELDADLASEWPKVLSPYLDDESLKTTLSQSASEVVLQAQVALPVGLNFASVDWYRALSLQVSGKATIDTVVAEYGVENLTAAGDFTVTGTVDAMAIAFPSPINAAINVTGTEFDLPDELTNPSGTLAIASTFDISQPVNIAGGGLESINVGVDARLQEPTRGFENLAVKGVFHLQAGGEEIRISLDEGLSGCAEPTRKLQQTLSDILGWQQKQAELIELETGPALSVTLNTKESSMTLLSPVDVILKSGPKGAERPSIANLNISTFDYVPGKSAVAADGEITMNYQQLQLPAINISIRGQQKNERWRVASTIDINQWKLSSKVNVDVDNKFAVKADGSVRAGDLVLLKGPVKDFIELPKELALASGEGEFKFGASFGSVPRTLALLDFQVGNLSGLFNDIAFNNGNLTGNIQYDRKWSMTKPLEIQLDQLSSGVSLEDISASVRLQPTTDFSASLWEIERFSAGLFGGKLALKDAAEIAWPDLGNRLIFQLSNVQLDRILALYAEQGISGHGVLNGEIPVLIGQDGVHIDKGNVYAEVPGGKIAFVYENSAAMAQTNEQLAMALRLLENFNFTVLNVDTDFLPTGDLTLMVNLVGNNPDEFDGQTVNFNVNFQENLFQLFRVLKLTDDLTEKIEKRLDKQSVH